MRKSCRKFVFLALCIWSSFDCHSGFSSSYTYKRAWRRHIYKKQVPYSTYKVIFNRLGTKSKACSKHCDFSRNLVTSWLYGTDVSFQCMFCKIFFIPTRHLHKYAQSDPSVALRYSSEWSKLKKFPFESCDSFLRIRRPPKAFCGLRRISSLFFGKSELGELCHLSLQC